VLEFHTSILAATADMPLHLLMPLLASVFFVAGLMLTKRANSQGVNSWTVIFAANMWAAAIFSLLLLRSDPGQPWHMFWQPLVVAILYIGGQTFTFLALGQGDVSIAAPIFSSKVIVVVLLVTFLAGEVPPLTIWAGATMAKAGIVLVQ